MAELQLSKPKLKESDGGSRAAVVAVPDTACEDPLHEPIASHGNSTTSNPLCVGFVEAKHTTSAII